MTEEQREKLRENERRRYYMNKAAGKERYTPKQKEARKERKREKYRKKYGIERVYTSRDTVNMTLREAGKIMGVSATTAMSIEREALRKFCDRLEAECEDLRKDFYAGLECTRGGNGCGVHRALPRCEMGRTG